MSTPWNAAPGELITDRERYADDYHDARCEECGAGPDESCTDDCECELCRRRAAEERDGPLMDMSESINEIAAALAKAQAEMEGAKKDTVNPFFKSKYPDLASVREACNGPLTKHGIAVIQSPSAHGNVVSVVTLLAHSSGQWMRGVASCTAKDDSPQSVGSATTYLRRYALQSFAGVAPEDDDGEAAHGRGLKAPTPPVAAPKPAPAGTHVVTTRTAPTKSFAVPVKAPSMPPMDPRSVPLDDVPPFTDKDIPF